MNWTPVLQKEQRYYTTRMQALKDADFVYVKNWSTYHDYGKMYTNDPEWMLTNEKLIAHQSCKSNALPSGETECGT